MIGREPACPPYYGSPVKARATPISALADAGMGTLDVTSLLEVIGRACSEGEPVHRAPFAADRERSTKKAFLCPAGQQALNSRFGFGLLTC